MAFVRCGALVLLLLAVPTGARAQAAQPPPPPADGARPGAVFAPAVLPSGASSVYGFLGVPELAAGFRQGLGALELEGRASVDYLLLALTLEGALKFPLVRTERFDAAMVGALGVVYSTGARYLDPTNFSFLGIRPKLGLNATLKLNEQLRALLAAEVPWAISVSPGGAWQLSPLGGGGVELLVREDVSLVAMGQLGVHGARDGFGVTRTRLGYRVVLGVGFRLF